jgi:hypothetical protein
MVVLGSGCGGSSPERAAAETSSEAQGLRQLGVMYKLVTEQLKRPPKDVGELRLAEAQVPGGFSGIGESNVAIYFGVALPGAEGGSAPDAAATILAYDRLAPSQGGYVLFLDGSVSKLSAEEFKTAKKAGKTAWTAPAGS